MTATASKKVRGSAPAEAKTERPIVPQPSITIVGAERELKRVRAKRSSFLTYEEWCWKVQGTARDTPANHALVREVVRALDDLEATLSAAAGARTGGIVANGPRGKPQRIMKKRSENQAGGGRDEI
ncbi:hypothetical protein [Cereibacter sphaeroides]|uniref:hypothetical protein n=1 Tax=Cereibacter sphaeroides TaxID=1063 RepID=UPI0005A2DC8D|nr:hypothetical protein [Cereibacter sphaeroides]